MDEALFTLKDATAAEGIKTHLVHGRVKKPKSIAEKARRREYGSPLEEVDDIVGVRVVVLFLSDLPRLDEIVTESFEVLTADDKVMEGDPASFGYMSVHYLATLKGHHSGPRYDDLKGMRLEIQTRTIVMDAWANVSHYLDYKGESSVPGDLRKDFFALSGLFYVADQHFELFSARAAESQVRAEEELRSDVSESVEINLDTVDAFLANRYDDRVHSERSSISEFVEEITGVGITSLAELQDALEVGDPLLINYEKERPPEPEEGEPEDRSPGRFFDLGAARISLALASEDYAKSVYPQDVAFEQLGAWGASA